MRRAIITSLAVALALGVASTAHAAPADRSTSDVWRFEAGSAVAGATSTMVRTDAGVATTLRTTGLTPGDAVTVWWVVFNHPEHCAGEEGAPFRCTEPDIFNPDVGASVQYAAGNVVGASGRYAVGAHLSVGDTSGCPFEAFGPGFLCAGLVDARGAEIHFVVRTHGSVDPAFMPSMIHTFEGGCSPETSNGLGDGDNDCADVQFAIHAP